MWNNMSESLFHYPDNLVTPVLAWKSNPAWPESRGRLNWANEIKCWPLWSLRDWPLHRWDDWVVTCEQGDADGRFTSVHSSFLGFSGPFVCWLNIKKWSSNERRDLRRIIYSLLNHIITVLWNHPYLRLRLYLHLRSLSLTSNRLLHFCPFDQDNFCGENHQFDSAACLLHERKVVEPPDVLQMKRCGCNKLTFRSRPVGKSNHVQSFIFKYPRLFFKDDDTVWVSAHFFFFFTSFVNSSSWKRCSRCLCNKPNLHEGYSNIVFL